MKIMLTLTGKEVGSDLEMGSATEIDTENPEEMEKLISALVYSVIQGIEGKHYTIPQGETYDPEYIQST